jgi:hypothetical protein
VGQHVFKLKAGRGGWALLLLLLLRCRLVLVRILIRLLDQVLAAPAPGR